jgi:hypothetical protein
MRVLIYRWQRTQFLLLPRAVLFFFLISLLSRLLHRCQLLPQPKATASPLATSHHLHHSLAILYVHHFFFLSISQHVAPSSQPRPPATRDHTAYILLSLPQPLPSITSWSIAPAVYLAQRNTTCLTTPLSPRSPPFELLPLLVKVLAPS